MSLLGDLFHIIFKYLLETISPIGNGMFNWDIYQLLYLNWAICCLPLQIRRRKMLSLPVDGPTINRFPFGPLGTAKVFGVRCATCSKGQPDLRGLSNNKAYNA